MRVCLLRSGFALVLCCFGVVVLWWCSAVVLSGCGGEKEDKLTTSEVELFAKAQELQKDKKHSEAVEIYRQICARYPTTKQGANSQFMIGYTYANDIKDFEQARIELQRFLDTYSTIADEGLVEGAKFELENLGKDIDEIPILIQTGEESDTMAVETEKKEIK